MPLRRLIRLPDVTRQGSGIRNQGSENQPIPNARRPIQNPGPALELDSYQDQNFPDPAPEPKPQSPRESSKNNPIHNDKKQTADTHHRHQASGTTKSLMPKTCQTNHPPPNPPIPDT